MWVVPKATPRTPRIVIVIPMMYSTVTVRVVPRVVSIRQIGGILARSDKADSVGCNQKRDDTTEVTPSHRSRCGECDE